MTGGNAIAYADKYCINYNSSYNSYKGRGGDCANFVSQCLYAGGFKQDSVWYKHSVAWINVMKQIAHFKAYGTFLNASNSNLIRGNPIYFDWNGDSTYDHATICVGRPGRTGALKKRRRSSCADRDPRQRRRTAVSRQTATEDTTSIRTDPESRTVSRRSAGRPIILRATAMSPRD